MVLLHMYACLIPLFEIFSLLLILQIDKAEWTGCLLCSKSIIISPIFTIAAYNTHTKYAHKAAKEEKKNTQREQREENNQA